MHQESSRPFRRMDEQLGSAAVQGVIYTVILLYNVGFFMICLTIIQDPSGSALEYLLHGY